MPAQRQTGPAIKQTMRHREADVGPGLTRAEEHALRRSEPLSPAQFKELRRLAEHGVSPLRRL